MSNFIIHDQLPLTIQASKKLTDSERRQLRSLLVKIPDQVRNHVEQHLIPLNLRNKVKVSFDL